MAEVTLSEYCDEAKELIRADSYDQAIAICRHILKQHPRYVRAYRVLGEACLEKGDYIEAANLFKRVLGADMEDMVVYVGLGIVFDEQGALDEAIWQLERAFELNPGNAEIRKELQRLYGDRDGAAPQKLKLTSAALGRLYMREELYQRAIDEFRTVLEEDSERADIQVALAQALWWSEQRQEAARICEAVLEQYPNCLKANLILGEILLSAGRQSEAQSLLDTAQAMDPENVVAHELFHDKSPLPSEAVTVPRLDREEMGEELEEIKDEAPVAGKGPSARKEGPPSGAGKRLDEATPDWLRKLQEEEKESGPEEVATPSESQEMPAWLRELAEESPEQPTDAAEASGLPGTEEGMPAWLGDLREEAEDLPSEETLAPVGPETVVELDREMAAPEEEMAAKAQEEIIAPSRDIAEPVDKKGEVVEPVSAASGPEEEPGKADEMPDWLSSLREEAASDQPVVAEEEVESAPSVTAPPEREPVGPEEGPPDVSEHTMDRLRETMPDESASIEEIMAWMEESKALLGEEEIPTAVPEEPELTQEAEPVSETTEQEQTPTWLHDLRPEAEGVEETMLEADTEAEEAAIPTQEDEMPTWLREMRPKAMEDEELPGPQAIESRLEGEEAVEEPVVAPEEPTLGPPEEPGLPVAEEEEMPSWLRDLREEAAREEPPMPSAATETPAPDIAMPGAEEEEMPTWLQDLREEAAREQPSVPREEPPSPAEEMPSALAEEEMPSWLRELRAEATGAEQVYHPEAGEPTPEAAEPLPTEEEEVPPWLQELRAEAYREEPPVSAEEPEALPQADLSDHMVEAELPSWLEELKSEVAGEQPEFELEETEAPTGEIPSAPVSPPVPAEPTEAMGPEKPGAAEVAEPSLDEHVPSWLRELRAQAAQGETGPLLERTVAADEGALPPIQDEELPSWLRDLRAGAAKRAAPSEPPAVETDLHEPETWAEEEEEEAEAVSQEPVAPQVVEEKPPVAEAMAEAEEISPEQPPEETPQPDWDVEQYVEHLDANPRDHTARLALARAYSQAGDLDQAALQYQMMLSFGGMIHEVTSDLESTVESSPDHLRTQELLADAYVRVGQLQKALDKYRWLRVKYIR
jgi:tetratricopeptide (TPR) repeat protein